MGTPPVARLPTFRADLLAGRRMRRSLALLTLLLLPLGGELSAQALDDLLVPRGRVRLQMFPIYTSWDSRFGRTADGVTGRERLGEDLTTTSAESLFPGSAALESAIEAMSGVSGYTPVVGEVVGRVTKDVTRVEFGGHIGVFDWLTVGAVLPWTRTRSNVDVYFRPDTLNGDLGLSPRATDPTGLNALLLALGDADSDAQANASQVCATSPGSPACASAQVLADRAASFSQAAATAYSASPFFPVAGSTTAASLDDAAVALDADLVAAGLTGIGTPMVFADQRVDEESFRELLPVSAALGIQGAPLGSVRSLWHVGDVEVSASVRLLEGAARDSAAAPARIAYRLVGTFLARLPTGLIDNPDVFLDVGTGDGQTDLEGRLLAELALGRRFSLRAAGRYGVQLPRTLIRRVAPPEQVLAPLSSRQLVEWDPGAYFGVEVGPSFRFSPELSVGGEYRVYRKWRDEYTLAGVSEGAPVDPVVMQIESGMTVHQVGAALRYDNVARRMAGESVVPLQLHFRLLTSVAGSGGQTPVTTHLEFGIRLFRRLWGAP
jgi:hypothetical protein